MDRWRVELGSEDKYLGIVEAEDDDDAVEAAIQKFEIAPSQRHKIMVSKATPRAE
jgi:hypothetical protein